MLFVYNLALTGKWFPGGGNQVVPLAAAATGETFEIASAALQWPSGHQIQTRQKKEMS
jgi:hypothetical protein